MYIPPMQVVTYRKMIIWQYPGRVYCHICYHFVLTLLEKFFFPTLHFPYSFSHLNNLFSKARHFQFINTSDEYFVQDSSADYHFSLFFSATNCLYFRFDEIFNISHVLPVSINFPSQRCIFNFFIFVSRSSSFI